MDLAEVTLTLSVNGTMQEQARGAEVLGTPIASIAWLANKLAAFGRRLEAASQVMSGSFTKQYNANRYDVVIARFDDFGSVNAEFL
jgi:2-keto-4-pentenoate hydratase